MILYDIIYIYRYIYIYIHTYIYIYTHIYIYITGLFHMISHFRFLCPQEKTYGREVGCDP